MGRHHNTSRETTTWSVTNKPLHWLSGVGFVLLFVVLPVVYAVHEDNAVARYYKHYFTAHPDQVALQVNGLGGLHIQTAFAVSQAALAISLAVATAVYVHVTRTARDDARANAAVTADAQERDVESQVRVVTALERIATAVESDTLRSGLAPPQIRSLLVINLNRRGVTR
jgi:hypothetical protein